MQMTTDTGGQAKTPSTLSSNTTGVKAFTQSMPFVLSFLTGTIFLQMIMGNDITYKFLWLVLISMVLVNGDKITNLLNGVKKLYE